MVVACRNRRGEQVTHERIRREGAGWIAKGRNNRGADAGKVNAKNLISVVYASFNSSAE